MKIIIDKGVNNKVIINSKEKIMAKLNDQTIKEQELINRQEESGNEVLCLMKIGFFFHAYNAGAYALARVMNYRVARKVRRSGLEMMTAGFPSEKLPSVLESITAAGGRILSQTDDCVEFTGVDYTPDGVVVIEKEKKVKVLAGSPQETDLSKIIRSYDLSRSTPIDAMLFIAKLQALVSE
jgi:hypothetical protein